MIENLLYLEITKLITANDVATLREILPMWPPPHLPALIERLPEQNQALVLRALPKELAATPFAYLDRLTQQRLLNRLSPEEIAGILNDMAPDDRTALLEEALAPVANELLALLTPEHRAVAQALLAYEKETIGRRMTPDGSVAKSTFWGRSRKRGAEKSETYRTQKHRFWFFATEPKIKPCTGERQRGCEHD